MLRLTLDLEWGSEGEINVFLVRRYHFATKIGQLCRGDDENTISRFVG